MKLDKPILITEQNWPSETVPVLSVFNWVYNHKEFIRESIESILMQKTTFPVEIIIHDDASNDGTKEIILEYQEKHPQLFKNILHEENQWSQGKSVMTTLFEKPRAKYIALTHGDDYWTDPYKLQKQVDFLEANNQISLVCTQYDVLTGSAIEPFEPIEDWFINNSNTTYKITKENFLNPYFLKTCTAVFRKDIITEHSAELFRLKYFSDVFIFALCLLKGNGLLMKDNTAVYKIHSNGIWSTKSELEKQRINFLMFREMNAYFSGRFSAVYEAYLGALRDLYAAVKKEKIRWCNLGVVYAYWLNKRAKN